MITGINSGQYAVAQDTSIARKAVFQRADQDGDGKVSRNELQAVLPNDGREPDADDILKKADANRDGVINESEGDNFIKAMQQQRLAPPAPEMGLNSFTADGSRKSEHDLATDLTATPAEGLRAQAREGVDPDFYPTTEQRADPKEAMVESDKKQQQKLNDLVAQWRASNTYIVNPYGGVPTTPGASQFVAVA